MNLKFLCLNLFLIILLRINESNAQGSFVPLDINGLITKINNHRFFNFNNDNNNNNVKNFMYHFHEKESLLSLNSFHFNNISTECSAQVKYLLKSIENKEFWALQSNFLIIKMK